MDEAEQTKTKITGGYTEMAAEIVAAYVANNSVQVTDLPALITTVHGALAGLAADASNEPVPAKLTPAQIRKSITPEALISFEDGKSYKTLRRHLSRHGLSPDEYRAKWGLPHDYPIVARSYSEARSKLATNLGLGRKVRQTEA